jgi:hypothetical protein
VVVGVVVRGPAERELSKYWWIWRSSLTAFLTSDFAVESLSLVGESRE